MTDIQKETLMSAVGIILFAPIIIILGLLVWMLEERPKDED